MGKGVKAVLPQVSRALAGAAGEGFVGMGLTAEEIRAQSEDGVITPEQSAIAVASGIGTGAFGVLGAKLAKFAKVADVDAWLVKAGSKLKEENVIKKILKGGITEGVFEELPQSAQEQIWMNAALEKPLMEGVQEAGALGMLSGGLIGGGFAGVTIGETQKTADELVDDMVLEGIPTEEIEKLGKTKKDFTKEDKEQWQIAVDALKARDVAAAKAEAEMEAEGVVAEPRVSENSTAGRATRNRLRDAGRSLHSGRNARSVSTASS